MLQQQGKHVYALTNAPRRGQTHPAPQQQPKGILKATNYTPRTQSPLASPSLIATPDPIPSGSALYSKRDWTLINIARADATASSSKAPVSGSNLTVTLLYYPSLTLFAWPFNLSRPDAKGVCYETAWIDEDQGVPRLPPADAMSTSLRVLTDVIRCWMKVRSSQSAAQKQRSSGASTPQDRSVDNDEVVDQIIERLGLREAAPLERAAHLVRQQLPTSPSASAESGGWRHSTTSSIDSAASIEDDDRQRGRSGSITSSQASTVESSPEQKQRALKSVKLPPPALGRIVTSSSAPGGLRFLPESSPSHPRRPSPIQIPEIKLQGATPVDALYTERDRVLGQPRGILSRKSSYSSTMDTVKEVSSEDLGAKSVEPETSPKVHPCDRPDSAASSDKAPSLPDVAQQVSSPKKPFFRVPFKTRTRSPPK